MSHSPILSRFPSGAPEPHAFLPLATINTTFAVSPGEGDEIVDTLRSAIAAGASALDPILTAIAEAAQTLTGATGAALALRTKGVIVCRARSGENAPELGAQVSESSGISGECLRTGKILRCDDTQKDYRVNAEVCRRLGLHSIAVLPLRARLQVAGVLETFSTRPYAFAEAQMTLLGRLAELAEAAYAQELSAQAKVQPQPAAKPAELVPGSDLWTHPNEAALRRLGSQVTTEDLRRDNKSRHRIAIAAALLLAASAFAWKASTKPRHEAALVAPVATAPAAPAEDSAPVALTNVTSRPAPASASESEMTISFVRAPRHDAQPEPEISDVVTRKVNSEAETPAVAVSAPEKNDGELVSSSLREPVAAAPKLETVAANGSSPLGSLLASPAALPKFSPPISQGVSGGALQHKVDPTYPQQAMALRLEGPVTLEATITPEGKVGKVKLVKGNPTLAMSAMDAVRQWRYSPYQLNGQPVSAQAEIVVNFKAPAR
jgi:TonB family protein